MLTVITLLKLKTSPNGEQHGERPFWKEHGQRYLDAWFGAVDRFVPQPHRVVVMTDTPHIDTRRPSHIEIDRPDREVKLLDKTVDAPGFWAKLEMFRHGEGKTLYMDLDNVINGPLDELVALEPDPLIMLDDKRVPGLPNGSMILFDAERCRGIWALYAANARKIERNYVARGEDYSSAYDQAYIAAWTRSNFGYLDLLQRLLPDGYILNALSELPNTPDWKTARVIFGCGANAKPHLSTHPAFSLDERSVGGW